MDTGYVGDENKIVSLKNSKKIERYQTTIGNSNNLNYWIRVVYEDNTKETLLYETRELRDKIFNTVHNDCF